MVRPASAEKLVKKNEAKRKKLCPRMQKCNRHGSCLDCDCAAAPRFNMDMAAATSSRGHRYRPSVSLQHGELVHQTYRLP